MWHYNNKLFETTPEEYQGFVYEITELDTGKNILERRISGNLKLSPSLKHVRDAYEHVQNLTGKHTTDHPMKYGDLWNHEEQKVSTERF